MRPRGGSSSDDHPQASRYARLAGVDRAGRLLRRRRIDRPEHRRVDHDADDRDQRRASPVALSARRDRTRPAHRQRHPDRRRRDLPGAALRGMVPDLQRPLLEHPDRLHAEWFGRRHHGHHPGDRRLRRLGRADEGHRDRRPAGRQEALPLPDRARRRRGDLQPAGRAQAPARRPDLGGDLPRQDHEVERPGARRPQCGRDAAGPGHPRRPPLRMARGRPTPSRPTSTRSTRPGMQAPAPARPSTGRPASVPRATTASRPRSSRPRARSATST